MDVYLYGSEAPPLMYSFDITQKVFHRRVGLDVHHTFTDWATPLTDTQLAFLVCSSTRGTMAVQNYSNLGKSTIDKELGLLSGVNCKIAFYTI